MPIAYVCKAVQTRYCAPARMWSLTRNRAVWLLAAGILCGCGSREPGAGSGSQAAPKTHAGKPADTLASRMVNAVPASKSSAVPVQVKFDLRQRPGVAQPLDIDLVIVPTSANVDRLSGKVVTDDGLELVDGADIPPTDRPAQGVPISHTIKVLPKRDGIFTFSAVVTVDTGGHSTTETYSMPLIAGAALSGGAPAKGTATAAKQ
jgi:hypothetical protein